jgi:hypothetical protein
MLTTTANRQDSILLASRLDLLNPAGLLPEHVTANMNRGNDYGTIRADLAARGVHARIAERGKLAPVQVGRCWVVERAHAWRRPPGAAALHRTTGPGPVLDFWIAPANTINTVRRPLRRPLPLGPPAVPDLLALPLTLRCAVATLKHRCVVAAGLVASEWPGE